jgi:arylsulfatase A-like enzyme
MADDTLVVFTSDNGCAPYIGTDEMEQKGHFASGPFRGYKSDAWEGGHRVPFIVRWPGVVKAGSTNGALVHQADLLATVAEILGEDLPPEAGEDSFSLLPLLKGEAETVRPHAVSASIRGLPAVRLGDWKYLPGPGSGGWTKGDTGPEQLYHLATDPGEQKNLAGERPKKLSELKATLETLIVNGRSTPGPKQANDVEVVRYPREK